MKRMNHPAWFLTPYWILFTLFIVVPTIMAILLSFTYFNTIQTPEIIGVRNYIELITMDTVFMQNVVPNTLKFALIVGLLGYVLAFLLAWLLAQIPKHQEQF